MRSYGQYCALAKALDLIGDRWNLLIVRELLIQGAVRYTDLLNGLPGIATNLLADRLAQLEEAGVVRRDMAPPPIATQVYSLTDRGLGLDATIRELGRWGGPLLSDIGDDAFRTHWLAIPAERALADHELEGPPITIELRSGTESVTFGASAGELQIQVGRTDDPDAVLEGSPEVLVCVVTGRVELDDAIARGLTFAGDRLMLRRLLPSAVPDGTDRELPPTVDDARGERGQQEATHA